MRSSRPLATALTLLLAVHAVTPLSTCAPCRRALTRTTLVMRTATKVALDSGVEMETFSRVPADDTVSTTKKPPLVFIHGSLHGGWCWDEHWLAYFCSRGFPSYSISLRGTRSVRVRVVYAAQSVCASPTATNPSFQWHSPSRGHQGGESL